MNPLLNPMQQPQAPVQNGNNLMDRIRQFGQMINGNPQQIVQNLLYSGRMSQQQFQQFAQTADQLLGRR
jgi:hypothetical protein